MQLIAFKTVLAINGGRNGRRRATRATHARAQLTINFVRTIRFHFHSLSPVFVETHIDKELDCYAN